MAETRLTENPLRSPAVRVVIAVVGLAVVVNAAGWAAERAAGGSPSGPVSSSYATAPEGLAAYASLLARAGHEVVRVRVPIERAALDPGSTVVVLDARVDEVAQPALQRFVSRGGRLVAGGNGGEWLRLFAGSELRLQDGDARVAPVAPVDETAGVRSVVSAGAASFGGTGRALPAITDRGGGVLLAVAASGEGRVLLLADASPLQNRLLARGDNAALGLALAGPAGRPVAFVESVHGYGTGRGIAAIPSRWRWCAALLVLASLAFMLWRGRRIGPPEEVARPFAPPRSAFVHAVAATLARTRDRERAADALCAAARAHLSRTAGLAPDADAAEVERAARSMGLAPDEAGAIAGRGGLIPAGRALAALASRRMVLR